jgi:cytochrome c biogenesis protein CcdA
MLDAVVVVLLLGLGDALNPLTLGPAMYLATVDHPRRRIAQFLAGFLAVNIAGGLLIMLGPGELLLDLVPKPGPLARHVLEIVAGVILVAVGVGLWTGRRTLRRRTPPSFTGGQRTGVMLGVGVAAVELPTALPYFAAIAVIVGSGVGLVGKVVLLLIFNAAFLLPVFAILIALIVLGDKANEPLARCNQWVLKHWPGVLAALAVLIGIAVLVLGVEGIISG